MREWRIQGVEKMVERGGKNLISGHLIQGRKKYTTPNVKQLLLQKGRTFGTWACSSSTIEPQFSKARKASDTLKAYSPKYSPHNMIPKDTIRTQKPSGKPGL